MSKHCVMNSKGDDTGRFLTQRWAKSVRAVAYLGGEHAAMPPPLGKAKTFFDQIH